MPGKQFPLAGVGEVTIVKRATNRNLRLSIKPDGAIVVTIPKWASYHSGLSFAESKRDWIIAQVPEKKILKDG